MKIAYLLGSLSRGGTEWGVWGFEAGIREKARNERLLTKHLLFKILLTLQSVFIQISNICQRNLIRYGSIIK